MAKLTEILSFTYEYLKCDRFNDYCPNGLQVEGTDIVNHLITGVSASVELFERAIDRGGDAILVHHGILWGSEQKIISGSYKKRINLLLKSNLSLLAYHLPLDAHEEVGNNISIANKLQLHDLSTFAEYKGQDIGYVGFLQKAKPFNQIYDQLQSIVKNDLIAYSFGSSDIKKIGIVTGGAADLLEAAVDEECDLFITGEVSEPTFHLAKEEKINFIAAGHYHTEKFGVQALGEKIANEFNIKQTFIDIPNAV